MINITLILLGSIYVLWLFFLACMNLKRAKEAGTLSKSAMVFGYPIVLLGYVIDFLVNTTAMTIILLELPQWQIGELLVTDRLKRLHKTGSGWRLFVALWFVPLLNPYDPDGGHI